MRLRATQSPQTDPVDMGREISDERENNPPPQRRRWTEYRYWVALFVAIYLLGGLIYFIWAMRIVRFVHEFSSLSHFPTHVQDVDAYVSACKSLSFLEIVLFYTNISTRIQ
jgi:hypothetical protein